MPNKGKNSDSKKDFQNHSDKVWNILDAVPECSEDFEEKILASSTEREMQSSGRSGSFSWVYRAAAAIFLLFGIGLLYFITQDDVTDITFIEYESVLYNTERGERKELHISDHIYVQINAETDLKIMPHKDKMAPRLVYLRGEAYFNVSDTPAGFEVKTDAGVVQVIGTAFNIRAREDEVDVVVESGLVSIRGLSYEDIDTAVQVPAGHRSVKHKNSPALEPVPIDIKKFLSWRTGEFVFEQTPLSDVIVNLERAYNVRIDLQDRNLDDIRVTGEFGQEPLMQILNEICWSANLRYRQEEDVYILYKPD